MKPSTPEFAVEVEDLEYAYDEQVALRGIDFKVERGQIFGLLGPNGGGKSTLFRILSTLVPLQRGHARVLGLDLTRQRSAVRERLGVVFQSPALDRKLTVFENLRHQGHLYGLHGARLRQRIDHLLERFGLQQRRNQLVEKLSGGLSRRVELAKCLLHQPEVLILDEPSTGLDPGARMELWRQLQEIRSQDGVTTLLTSHILEEVEDCDHVAILDRGALVASGSPTALKDAIGGEVITITTPDTVRLAGAIAQQFNVEPSILEGYVRIEHQKGTTLLKQIVESFKDDIASVTLSKPTLEDVFIRSTGHAFWEDGEIGHSALHEVRSTVPAGANAGTS